MPHRENRDTYFLQRLFVFASLTFLLMVNAKADSGVLVTLLEGDVTRATELGVSPVQSFSRLKEGDMLALAKGGKLRLVYLSSGRQESWEGSGQLEVGVGASKPRGLAEARVIQLPPILVKQLDKTPLLDAQGRAGMTRLRNIPTADAIAKIESTYRDLRAGVSSDDMNPEMYLLSAMFELRAFDRVEQVVAELRTNRGGDPQAKLLVALYQRALKNAKDNGNK